MWGWGESESSPRNEKVEMVPPIETSLDPKIPSYSNVQELQPILLKQSNTNPYQLDFLVCRICKHFAINPRQCCVCKALTCSECANRTENPQICPNCIEHGYLQGLLGKPNLLEGNSLFVSSISMSELQLMLKILSSLQSLIPSGSSSVSGMALQTTVSF